MDSNYLSRKITEFTTILSSMGSACDHIDHVKTQLPYALTVAAICAVCYLIVGLIVA